MMFDDFEDGSLSEWSGDTGKYSIVASNASSGSNSLECVTGDTTPYSISRSVSQVSPDSIGVSVQCNGGINQNTYWKQGSTEVIRVLHRGDSFSLQINGVDLIADPNENQMYRVVAKNIDWDNNVIGSVEVDGTEEATDVPFQNNASYIDTIEAADDSFGGSVTTYRDEFSYTTSSSGGGGSTVEIQSQSFEGSGWSYTEIGDTSSNSIEQDSESVTAQDGSNYYKFDNTDDSPGYARIEFGQVDLSGYSSAEVSAYLSKDQEVDNADYLIAQVSHDGGSTWSDIEQINGGQLTQEVWTQFTWDLGEITDQTVFRIEVVTAYLHGFCVDNFVLTGTQAQQDSAGSVMETNSAGAKITDSAGVIKTNP